MDLDISNSVVPSLWVEFAYRFADVRSLSADFKLFTTLFDLLVEDTLAHLQVEFVELQCNDELKAQLCNSSPLSFVHDLILLCSNFTKYIAHFQHILAMFGCTCCYKKLSSKLKYAKSHLCSHVKQHQSSH